MKRQGRCGVPIMYMNLSVSSHESRRASSHCCKTGSYCLSPCHWWGLQPPHRTTTGSAHNTNCFSFLSVLMCGYVAVQCLKLEVVMWSLSEEWQRKLTASPSASQAILFNLSVGSNAVWKVQPANSVLQYTFSGSDLNSNSFWFVLTTLIHLSRK